MALKSCTHHNSAQECNDLLSFPTTSSAEQALHKVLHITHLNWLWIWTTLCNYSMYFLLLPNSLFCPKHKKNGLFTADYNTIKPRTMHAENIWIFLNCFRTVSMFTIRSFLTNYYLTVASLWPSSNAVKTELYKQALMQFHLQRLKAEQIINFCKSKQRFKHPEGKCLSAFSILGTLFKYWLE